MLQLAPIRRWIEKTDHNLEVGAWTPVPLERQEWVFVGKKTSSTLCAPKTLGP